ncbi:DNA-formamidopyrimidine glycosylase [Candidatus Parcubacteria bacterium]|nr:DNA-formamidopyrimidine glycosylase [Candidatus Parcubacteria bacterium]
MPELPEVQTTVNGINDEVKGLSITDAWTDYKSLFHANKQNIKNPEYFSQFKKDVVKAKITGASRKGKNVLIHLSNGNTILTHMKMTGHFMYGKYVFAKKKWTPADPTGPLGDPYNRHIHLLFTLSDKNHLAFADLRKFAKVFVFKTKDEHEVLDLMHLGPDPLSKNFSYELFKEKILKRSNGRIKQVLMDQTLISGIGNIYSDEILWSASVHPESKPGKIPATNLKKMYEASKEILKKGINFGGDSDSDYRNIYGEKGKFQSKHNAYRRTGEKCPKHDGGIIERKMIAGRSGHFCPKHQKLYK